MLYYYYVEFMFLTYLMLAQTTDCETLCPLRNIHNRPEESKGGHMCTAQRAHMCSSLQVLRRARCVVRHFSGALGG
jgi:hypothetical protein